MYSTYFTASKGALLLLCLLVVSCRSASERQDILPQTHIVEIRDFTFVPQTISVSPGDTIKWVNKGFIPHTATEKNGMWDSGQLNENDTWTVVVDSSFSYYCIFHPAMIGKIDVF